MGTLDEVLQDQGWQKTDQTWSAPVVVSSQNETIEIPLHMLEHATHHTNLQKKV